MITTYLYIKMHKITKLKYFGKTTRTDVAKYTGSGKYWKNHIKKHGTEHIITLRTWAFNDIEECKQFAAKFSINNQIAVSCSWANLINENGIDGGSGAANPMFGKTHTQDVKDIIRSKQKARITGSHWYNNGIISLQLKAPQPAPWVLGRLTEGCKNPFYGRTHSIETRANISKTKIGIPTPKTNRAGYEKYIYTIYWVDGRIEISTNLSVYGEQNNIKLNLARFTRPNPPKSKTLIKIEKVFKPCKSIV